MPIYLSEVGFLPGIAMIILVGIAAIFSALFIAESFLRFKENLHLPRLAEKLLGKGGLVLMFSGILIYIYGALIGYLSAGGQVIYEITGGMIPVYVGILIYFALGTLIIYLGLHIIQSSSTFLFSLMMILLVGLIGLSFMHINFNLLTGAEWSMMPITFGILVFAFTGHTIIPSIGATMRKDAIGFKKVCLWGILIPLIFYLIWFFVLCGVVPYGNSESITADPLLSKTMLDAKSLGQPATIPLAHLIGGHILILATLFTLFSTFTSFLGFGISLEDSYMDISKGKLKKYIALALTVVPPLLIALWNPYSFLDALDIAGLYGGGLIIGILPALMILKSRKIGERKPEFVTPGGNIAPILIFLFFLAGLVYKTCLFFI